MAGLVLAYYAVTLYPFKLRSPQFGPNPVEVLDNGSALRFDGIAIARSHSPPILAPEDMRAGRLVARLRLATADIEQYAAARILTSSWSHSQRNFAIAQDGNDLLVFVRTQATDANGEPGVRVPEVLAVGVPVDVEVRADNGTLEVFIEGELRSTTDLPADPFREWSDNYRVALGNEFDPQREIIIIACNRLGMACSFWESMGAVSDKAWRGTIYRAEFGVGLDPVNYMAPGALTIPSHLLVYNMDPEFVPFFRLGWKDAAANLVGFLPLGFVLACVARRNRTIVQGLSIAAALGFLMSLSIEIGQAFVPGRAPSVTDIFMNVGGAVMGWSIAVWRFHLRPPSLLRSGNRP